MLETGFGQMMAMVGGFTLVTSLLALLAPVQGVHKRIVQSKDTELSWVNVKIMKQRKSLQSQDFSPGHGGMADLVAYRGLVENVSEWPFTTSTYTRILLYALLPVLTWGVGLFAEELVGRALF